MKILWAAATLSLCSCAIATMAQERRLAPADQTYQVGKILVVPFAMTDDVCKDDLDRGARKATGLRDLIAAAALKSLQSHQYAALDSALTAEQLKPLRKSLGDALCSQRPLGLLPPEVTAVLDDQLAKQGADAALVGGISTLRWHLKLAADGVAEGVSSDKLSEFVVRAEAGLYDAKSKRVIWSETVDSTQFLASYEAAVNRTFGFDAVKVTDPHQMIFYDFPPAVGSSAPAQATR